jgi:hypothetical protein
MEVGLSLPLWCWRNARVLLHRPLKSTHEPSRWAGAGLPGNHRGRSAAARTTTAGREADLAEAGRTALEADFMSIAIFSLCV